LVLVLVQVVLVVFVVMVAHFHLQRHHRLLFLLLPAVEHRGQDNALKATDIAIC
jgi:hypothetical protein